MSFIIDANLLYVWSSTLNIFIILVQFMRIFIASNQQQNCKALISIYIPAARLATYAPVMNLPLLQVVKTNFSITTS
jgi:hypothetical protein